MANSKGEKEQSAVGELAIQERIRLKEQKQGLAYSIHLHHQTEIRLVQLAGWMFSPINNQEERMDSLEKKEVLHAELLPARHS